jgi:hypothetical protein
MSSGHDSDQEPVLNSQALDRILANPKVQQCLWTPREENDTDFDCAYLAGYSTDGKLIFFDRHLPQTLSYEQDGHRREFNPRQFVRLHEIMEKCCIDILGMSYWPAHAAANGYERRHVLCVLGPGAWPLYSVALDPFIKADETEKLTKVPRNLDMTPYLAPPQDRALIARIQAAQGRERRYTKAAVHYEDTRGTRRQHCGKDKDWGSGCRYFEHPAACELVRGYIAPRGLCDEYEPYEAKK